MTRSEDISLTRRQLVKGAGLAGAALVGMGLAACSGSSSGGAASSQAASSSTAASSAAPASSATASSAAASQVAPVAGRSLVAFFSRAGENADVGYVEEGNTAVLAYMISGKVVSEVFEIEPAEPYPESYDETLAIGQRELDSNERPALAQPFGDLSGFGNIYLGFPTWYGHLPRVVLTFLESLDWSGKTIMPFNTSGSSGFSSTLDELKAACPGATIREGLTVRGVTAQNDRETAEKAVNEWLAKVRK